MTNTNWPTLALELNTTRNPNDPSGTDTWVNITPYSTEVTTKRGRPDELADVQAGTMDLVLLNDASRFDPSNASGPYYPNLLAWRQARLRAQWAPTGNLLDANTASVETDASGWLNEYNCDLSQSTTFAADGTHSLRVNLHTGAPDNAVIRSATAVLTTPGQIYTALFSLRSATARSFGVAIEWHDANDALITYSATTSATSTTTGFTEVRVSGVAPAGAVKGYVYGQILALASTSEFHYVDKAGLFQGTYAGTWAAGSGVISSVFRGYEETFWPQSWTDAGTKGWCKPTFIDAFGALAKIGLDDAVIAEMLADTPLALYPLSDGGGTSAGNISGTKQSNATASGLPNYAFGATGVVTASSATAMQITQSGATSPTYLSMPTGAIPAVGVGTTWEFWLRWDVAAGIGLLELDTASQVAALSVSIGGSSDPGVSMQAPGGTNHAVNAGSILTTGEVVHIAVVLNAAGSSVTFYVNGVSYGSTPASGAFTSFTAMRFGATSITTGAKSTYAMFATYSTALSSTRISAHYTAGTTGFSGDTAGTRAGRLLDYAAWLSALRNLDTTSVGELDTPLQGTPALSGTNALQALKDAVNSANGDLDVDADGKVRYRSRDYRLLQTTPAYTFGENELPYTDLPETGAKPDKLFSAVQVTQQNGIVANRGSASAALSYFPSTLSKTVQLSDPEQVIDLADDLNRRYNAPAERAASFVLDPASNPNLWPAVLGMDYGTRIRVMRRPNNGAVKTIDCYVESISHHINFAQGVWQTTVTTSAAPPYFPWVLGDATYGVLGSTTTPCM